MKEVGKEKIPNDRSKNLEENLDINSIVYHPSKSNMRMSQGAIAPYEKNELLSKDSSNQEQAERRTSCHENIEEFSDNNNNEDSTSVEIIEGDRISVVFCDNQSTNSPDSIVNVESNVDELDEKPHFDSVSLSEPSCRVCQCNANEEKLISPCFCSGSVKWIHESCLIQWMKSSLKDSCELCTKKIKITKRRKPLSKWKLPSQRPTPVLWVLVFITAIALNLASVVKDASRLCKSTPCLVFYAVGCIGVVLGTLFLIYWSKRARIFISHWVELNEEWVIIVGDGEDEVECNASKDANKLLEYCSITVHT